MIQKYPVGLQDFEKIRSEQFLYVDKTRYAHDLALIGGYYFLSRPRRFGKSLMISTLECLFDGRRDLFEGLYVEDKWDWSKTNPVIRISFSNIGHKEKGLYLAIDEQLNKIAIEKGIELNEEVISGKFKEIIEKLSKKQGKVVVLIDEYDKPIIDYIGEDTKKAEENRDIMKIFYSILKDADPYLKLVFITGVSKFSRVSIFSDLNNLTDITVDRQFAAICGITEEELEVNFVKELEEQDRSKIKEWYNGYSWDVTTKVYNPFSLLHFFRSGEYKVFWFESGTPTFLVKLSEGRRLYDFDKIEVGVSGLNAYNLDKLETIPLMFQTGYLTIKSYNKESRIYTLSYPNREVRESYVEALMAVYSGNDLGFGLVYVDKLKQALINGNMHEVKNILNTIFSSLPYELWQKENEHFYHAIIHLAFTLLGVYVQSEVQTSDGRMDALVQVKDYVYCFEFKLDKSADEAIGQIKDKGYLDSFVGSGKKRIAVGVNFSRDGKKVEQMKWEELES